MRYQRLVEQKVLIGLQGMRKEGINNLREKSLRIVIMILGMSYGGFPLMASSVSYMLIL